MKWIALSLIGVALGLLGCGEPVTYDENKAQRVCNRAACWDDKSPSPISADEWDMRERERNERDGTARK
jgi:hypothetical protein